MMGIHYAKGLGVRKDYVQSCAWLLLASEKGDPAILRALQEVGKKLNRSQLDDARALADGIRKDYTQALQHG